jgi:hypothetical protein
MARKAKAGATKQPAVREAAVEYEIRSMAEVFWTAFKSITPEAQGAFLARMLDDPEWYEEIADAVIANQRRNEPSIPYEEFAEELRRAGRL